MSEIQLLLELVKQQSANIDQLAKSYAVLNEHSISWATQMAGLATKIDILMWITMVTAAAIIGIFIERLGSIIAHRKNGNTKKEDCT